MQVVSGLRWIGVEWGDRRVVLQVSPLLACVRGLSIIPIGFMTPEQNLSNAVQIMPWVP